MAAASFAAIATVSLADKAAAQDTIKVGVLHSLSGTMAISETTLKDVMLTLRCGPSSARTAPARPR